MTEDFAFTIQKIETEQQLNLATMFLGTMLILSEVKKFQHRDSNLEFMGGICDRKLVPIKASLNFPWDQGFSIDLSASWLTPSVTAGFISEILKGESFFWSFKIPGLLFSSWKIPASLP